MHLLHLLRVNYVVKVVLKAFGLLNKLIFCWLDTCVISQQNLQGKRDKMAVKESNQLNELVGLMRDKWQDNAVEALAGLLSTVVSEKQLQVLIDDLRQK